LGNRPKKDLEEEAIGLRRDRVLELTSQGFSQRQIANLLQVGHSTVGNDVTFLRQKARENIRNYIDKQLPEEYDKVLTGLTSILREAWTAALRTDDTKEKISALSLAKEVYSTKLDLLTNINVVNDAARFIELHKNKDKEKENRKEETNNNNNIKNNNQEIKEETTNKVF
jgi:predicted transcriptional regulator